MNRAWITGITLATVAGTGTAAYAGMHANTEEGTAQAAAQPTVLESTTSAAPAVQELTFQAGPAGTVNVSNDGVAIAVASVMPTSGWTLVSYTPAGTHVEVVLTDGTQNLTFLADLIDGKVTASVSATSLTTLPPETTVTTPTTPAPQPAVPPVVLVPATQPPTTAHTSSPSGSGSGGEHEDEDDEHDEHESEHEYEEGGDD